VRKNRNTLVNANAKTGYIEIFSRNTGKLLLEISLPTGDDFIRTTHALDLAIRKTEKEAYRHAGEVAKSAVLNLDFESLVAV